MGCAGGLRRGKEYVHFFTFMFKHIFVRTLHGTAIFAYVGVVPGGSMWALHGMRHTCLGWFAGTIPSTSECAGTLCTLHDEEYHVVDRSNIEHGDMARSPSSERFVRTEGACSVKWDPRNPRC